MDIQDVDNSQTAAMSTSTGTDEAEGIWSADIEQSFLEALAIYPPCGRRKIILTEEGKMYGRNELVARYIKIRTGKTRTRKQVSSHLQVLAKRRSKELQALRNDKNAQQMILQRLKQLTSAEIVSMGHEQIISTNTDSMVDESTSPSVFHAFAAKEELDLSDDNHTTIGSPAVKKMASRKISSTNKSNTPKPISSNNSMHSASLSTSPNVFHQDFGRSRCSSNTSSSSPLSSGSIGSQSLAILSNTPGVLSTVIGDEHFRLHELSAFLEIRHTMMNGNHSTLLFPPTETQHSYQRHILRLHASDIQMKTVQMLETISVDQISDKFPRHDGLKDLFEKYPSSPFFLIKFWCNVSNTPNIINVDESFFTTFTYIRSTNRPIHISTRLCSFGRQVLEKVDNSEHPQHDSYDQYIHRFDRSPLCDYMVQFIQKLRSLPNTFMMNSVLENFTILQTIKCFNNPEQLLLCLAFVFEINVMDSVGPQYQVYKLV